MNAELLFFRGDCLSCFKSLSFVFGGPHFTTEPLKVESSLFRAVSPGNILASMI